MMETPIKDRLTKDRLAKEGAAKEGAAKDRGPKAEHLHIRASGRDKKTLAQAARLQNQSVSQFLLQLALPVAEEIVESHARESAPEVQTVFTLNDEAWDEFTRLLDAPPRELPELKKLLASHPVWE
jgi:uncharacterized protein (DUF1778 family)